MAALKRGVAKRYAEGESDVSNDSLVPVQVPIAPADTRVLPTFSSPPPPPVQSGFGQLMSGVGQAVMNRLPTAISGQSAELPTPQFAAARDNPASSPATSVLGQFGDYLSRSTRAQQVAAGPSLKDWTVNLFSGDQASTAALQQRAAAAQHLKDPLVQQTFMINPHALAQAEKDPVGFATAVQHPDFRTEMARAVGATTAAAANPKVTPDEHARTTAAALNANVHPDVAHVAVAPNKYTEDEFVKTFSGVPVKTFALLFGQQLGHVSTPQEKIAREIFDRLHGDYSTAHAKVQRMEMEDAAAKDKGLNPVHSQSPLFGKSPYDIAKAERDARLKVLMDTGMAYAGMSAKPYPVPGQQQ